MSHIHRLQDLVVPNGSQDSNWIGLNPGKIGFGAARAFMVFPPAALDGGNADYHVSYFDNPITPGTFGVDWFFLVYPAIGVPVIIPGKATILGPPTFLALKVKTVGVQTADRTFRVLVMTERSYDG